MHPHKKDPANYPITPASKRNNAVPRPHRYPVGAVLGRLTVLRQLPRVIIVKTSGKLAHNYLLQCRCGQTLERDQGALRHAERLGRVQMCDECARRGTKRGQDRLKAFDAQPPAHWGYDPREAM